VPLGTQKHRDWRFNSTENIELEVNQSSLNPLESLEEN
jgi:hypothetical protein